MSIESMVNVEIGRGELPPLFATLFTDDFNDLLREYTYGEIEFLTCTAVNGMSLAVRASTVDYIYNYPFEDGNEYDEGEYAYDAQ